MDESPCALGRGGVWVRDLRPLVVANLLSSLEE